MNKKIHICDDNDGTVEIVSIIIISADKDTAQIAQQVGADSFLCKPFDIEELENVVKEYTT